MLQVQDIQTSYGTSQVLFGMSLEVNEGECVTLLGRNGMGKTTTIRSIMGITRPHGGSVMFKGEAINALPAHRIPQRGIGLVPEGRQIFPNLSVRENLVATAANRLGRKDPWTYERVLELFPALAARRSNMGNQLSGGEQQMLAVARALTTNPEILILDEATEGLAPLVREEIWRVLKLLKEQGQAILVIDKNVDILTQIANRHYIIEKGKVVWSGDSETLRKDEDLQHRYLGV